MVVTMQSFLLCEVTNHYTAKSGSEEVKVLTRDVTNLSGVLATDKEA